MPHSGTKSPYKVQVLDRAMALFDALSESPDGSTLAELSEKLQLHKSTAHRLIMVLERHRLIEKQSDTGRYRLGLKLFELGSRAIAGTDLREHARPHLQRVVYATDETVHLCILDGGEVVYVDKVEPQRSVRMTSSVGRRGPAHCTAVGKAMLAALSDQEIDQIIRRTGLRTYTQHTLTTPAELFDNLRQVRTRGFAIDDEEHEEGVRCVGAAILDAEGRPAGAVSVSGPAFRVTTKKISSIAPEVVAAAGAISSQLGFRAPVIKAIGSIGS